MIDQLIRTPFTDLVGVRHPVVQTGMGWVSGARLVSGTANAGGLGILASATMSLAELEAAIVEVKGRTDQPFGVNLRADAGDAEARCDLLVEHGVKVASFALAPKEALIARLKENGVVVMPSIGAAKHAVKVAGWGADAVMVQGGEGGGHTGAVPTSLLLPTVLDAVDIPVIAAGGYFDGRGLAGALSYGAAGIGMGTRFLLTRDSAVPQAVKELYLATDLNGTVVTAKVDGMPHRMLRTDLVESVEATSAVKRLGPTARRTLDFKRESGMSWAELLKDGRAMRKAQGRSLGQMALAANTPVMLKAGLVDGDTGAGVLASGQVVGVIDDLPSCEELLDRVATDAPRYVDDEPRACPAALRRRAESARHDTPTRHLGPARSVPGDLHEGEHRHSGLVSIRPEPGGAPPRAAPHGPEPPATGHHPRGPRPAAAGAALGGLGAGRHHDPAPLGRSGDRRDLHRRERPRAADRPLRLRRSLRHLRRRRLPGDPRPLARLAMARPRPGADAGRAPPRPGVTRSAPAR